MAFAKRYHYIDDDDYAARYFEIYGDKKSVRQLAAELRRKGIDRETVDRLAGESGGDEMACSYTYLDVYKRQR